MSKSKEITITITGDVHLGSERVKNLALNGEAEKLLGEFFSTIRSSDVSIVNLESPLTGKDKALPKIGPNLKSPTGAVKFLVEAGVDIVTLANNHIMDYGECGLEETLETCELNGIKSVGAGLSIKEAKKTLFLDLKEIKVAVINIAENEFGTIQNQQAGTHSLNPVDNYYTINRATAVADCVIIIIHGGHEHYTFPSPRMKETYRFFVDAGADFVVGHHPHCISGYETYNGGRIFYSLGNFLFDKASRRNDVNWNRGMFLELNVSKKKNSFKLVPYRQNSTKPGLQSLAKKEKNEFQCELEKLSAVIADDRKLSEKFDQYIQTVRRSYEAFIEPHSLLLVHALRNRNLLPSLLTNRKKRILLNLMRCEAHNDVIKKILSK